MFILIPIIIYLAIFTGLLVFSNRIFKTSGHKTLGRIVSIFIIIAFSIIPGSFIFEDILFSKKDAKIALKDNNIELLGDIKFINKDISGMMDYILQFEIEISITDKEQIVKNLRSSVHLSDNEEPTLWEKSQELSTILEKDTMLYSISETDNNWNIERMVIIKNGYMRTNDIVQVSKTDNRISMIRNE